MFRRLTTNTIQPKTIRIEIAASIARVVEPHAFKNQHVMKGYDEQIPDEYV